MYHNTKKIAVTLLAFFLPLAANAGTKPVQMNNVVVDIHGNQVRTASGDCVYTIGQDPKGIRCEVSLEKNVMHKLDIVYFDFNKSNLKKAALAEVNKVHGELSQYNDIKITLVGHADFVGTEAYNLKLSKRRAESVKKELVKLGIPKNEIQVEGKGFSELMVPTKKGVKESKNRRVEMFYSLY